MKPPKRLTKWPEAFIKIREQENCRHFWEIPIEGLLVCFVVGMGPGTIFFKRELM